MKIHTWTPSEMKDGGYTYQFSIRAARDACFEDVYMAIEDARCRQRRYGKHQDGRAPIEAVEASLNAFWKDPHVVSSSIPTEEAKSAPTHGNPPSFSPS